MFKRKSTTAQLLHNRLRYLDNVTKKVNAACDKHHIGIYETELREYHLITTFPIVPEIRYDIARLRLKLELELQ